MVDLLAYIVVRGLIALLNLLPVEARVRLISLIIRTIVRALPAYRRVSMQNLALVFPERGQEYWDLVYRQSFDSLARVFVDFARLEHLDKPWVDEHIECPFFPRFEELKRNNPGKGLVIATGHLGSFELLAHFVATRGYPISFIVRNFKLPRLDRWWTGVRERNGNKVIGRKGAVKEVLKNLNEGIDAALLFDQNLTRNHALFVPWFGKLAATTMTVGLAAVRTEAVVLVSSIRYLGQDRYRVEAVEVPCEDIYQNPSLSYDEKMVRVTDRATRVFEKMILQHPEGWFWMHRRWKTVPEGEQENFYT